ncbi:MAG: hypothetical protein AAF788_05945 [Pseudomonadota bacterium]
MMSLSSDLIAQAGFRMGALTEAVGRSPLRALWCNHEAARVVARLFTRGAEPLTPEDLLALVAEVPSGVPSLERAAARRFWRQGLTAWRQPVDPSANNSVVSLASELADLALEGLPPGDMALEAPLRAAALTGWPLPPVSLAVGPESTKDDFMAQFLKRLGQECHGSLERLRGLERDFERWRAQLPDRRSDSRLEETLVLLGTVHALTPRYVAETLGVTRQGSARLLRKLEDLGIIHRGTSRQRWIIYLAENAAPSSIIPKTTRRSDHKRIDTAQMDAVLEQAYAALDRAVRRDSA